MPGAQKRLSVSLWKQWVNTIYYVCLLGSSLQITSFLCILRYHLSLLLSPPLPPTLSLPTPHTVRLSFVLFSDSVVKILIGAIKYKYAPLPQSLVFKISLWPPSSGKLRNWSVEIHISPEPSKETFITATKNFSFWKEMDRVSLRCYQFLRMLAHIWLHLCVFVGYKLV